MKKIISALLLSSFLIQSQAKASIMVGILSVGFGLRNDSALVDQRDHRLVTNIVIVNSGMVLFTTAMVSFVSAAGGPVWIPTIFAALNEDGSLPQEEIEAKLAEKYSFITDREIIRDLTQEIVMTADAMELDAEGKKIVSIKEERLREILGPSELNEEEIQIVVKDLK